MGNFNFQNHPFKEEILKMFDDGKNPYHIEAFLKSKGDEFLLSRPTLYKHYNYYIKATKQQKSKEQTEHEKFKTDLEEQLWDTIKQCNSKIEDKTLGPKEWQYFDQQKQAAIEKLMKLKDSKGGTVDASEVLTRFFQKFTIDKALKEEPESDETIKDDNKPRGSGDILPGESV